MTKLPRLPAAAVVAALKRMGFEEVRQKGSHLVFRRTMLNADGSAAAVICVVPLHRRDLAVGTLASVLRQSPRAIKIRYFPVTA